MAEEHHKVAWDAARPIQDTSVRAAKQRLKDVLDPAYWRRLATAAVADLPGVAPLTLGGDGGGSDGSGSAAAVAMADAAASAVKASLSAARAADLRGQVGRAGFVQVAPNELAASLEAALPGGLASIARGVEGLLRAGWPASFVLVYDEAWALIGALGALVEAATGNRPNLDALAWYVDPKKGDAGFSPHRDRQPPGDTAAATFRADGSPMYATAWLALTDATPDNSCLYVIPSYADPGYKAGDPEDEGAPDPLSRALPTKEAFQHVRALPTPAGGAAVFSHRIIHWGGKGAGADAHTIPRVSFSVGCADPAYEPPYLALEEAGDEGSGPRPPPLRLRVALAAAQQLIYHERFPATAKQLALFHAVFRAEEAAFEPGYARKVRAEFVAATRDHDARAARNGGGGGGKKVGGGGGGSVSGAVASGNGAGPSGKPKQSARAQKQQQQKQQKQQPKAKKPKLSKKQLSEEEQEEDDDSDEGDDALLRALEDARARSRKRRGDGGDGGANGGESSGGVGGGSDSDEDLADRALEEMLELGSDAVVDDYEE